MGKPLVVLVHGVGRQLRLDTMKSFLHGIAGPSKYNSRAHLAEELIEKKELCLEWLPFDLVEFNYSKLILDHDEYLERNPKLWIQSFRNRLLEIDNKRAIDQAPSEEFHIVENIAKDIQFSSMLVRQAAERFKLQPKTLEHAATEFLQQVQLYIDREAYRKQIRDGLSVYLGEVHSRSAEPRDIYLIAHSLGTVVSFQTILRGAEVNSSWFPFIKRFVTFGSPLDLMLLLFPEIFPKPQVKSAANIRWTNYFFGNDAIATDLAIARNWVVEFATGVFAADAPDEVDLGPGSMLTAHTDYWKSAEMHTDIIADQSGNENGSASLISSIATNGTRTVQPIVSRAFAIVGLATSFIAGGTLVLWWEENVKENNAQRILILSDPGVQLLIWIVATLMIAAYAKCWSGTMKSKLVSVASCFVFTAVLIAVMPPLQVFGTALPVRIERLGNSFLLLSPIFGLLGIWTSPSSERFKGWNGLVAFVLGIIGLFCSLFLGTRDNPSNIVPEMALFSLMFGFWWLSVLLFRIDDAFRSFVGGRLHLDKLCKRWDVKPRPREFRKAIVDQNSGT